MPRDLAQAVQWYRRAANQGVAQAQTNLGVLLSQGRGAAADPEQAYFWLSLTAAQDATARAARDQVARKLSAAQRLRLETQAAAWSPQP